MTSSLLGYSTIIMPVPGRYPTGGSPGGTDTNTQRSIVHHTGRILVDQNWRGPDANYGGAYNLIDDDYGLSSGAPTIITGFKFNTRHISQGAKIKKVTITGRCNVTTPGDLKMRMSVVSPTTEAQWASGITAVTENIFLDDKLITPAVGTANTAALTDIQRREFNLDYTVPDDGLLFFVFAGDVPSATARYFYGCFSIEYEL